MDCTMMYREWAPSAPLRRYVRCFWIAEHGVADIAAAAPQRVLPDGCMDIIVARHSAARDGREAFAITAVGAMTRYLDATPLTMRLGVRFEPGMAAPFLRVPGSELRDLEVPLDDLWGGEGRRLLERIAKARSTADRVSALDGWLCDRLAAAPCVDADVLSVVHDIVARRGAGPVGESVRASVRSERQLRRRFENAVGLSPKRFARIVRLQHVLGRSAAKPARWADVALDAGYYDQAHMIAEFRALTGRTPAEAAATRA
jgi:AraC-like DNA-binding protein